MARVTNSIKQTVLKANEYSTEQLNLTDSKIRESEELIKKIEDEGNFNQTNIIAYKKQLIQEAKKEKKNQNKMERWLLGFLNVTTPTAFTDAEIDAIDPEIRTVEE